MVTANQPDQPPAGINVIGHVAANLGVGVATRQVIDLIESLGHPVAAFDVDQGTKRELTERRFDRITHTSADSLPYRINLFVLGLGAVDWALGKCPDRWFRVDHLNAIICFWELPMLSKARLAQLDALDVVIGASAFLRHIYQQLLHRATVLEATLPVVLPTIVPFSRASLGIPESATIFVFSFDPASDPERKNPEGIVRAFFSGVGDDADAWLIIRINNATMARGAIHPILDTLRVLAGSHPRVRFMTEPLSYAQVLGLYRASDVYVSLHRAEGLGLGMAEAMTMGLPVIATGWSGNLTFMRATSACLVNYRMGPVRGTLPAYRESDLVGQASWAEPDVNHAAAHMRRLHRDRRFRETLGACAAAAMEDFNANAARGAFVAELFALQEQRAALADVGYRRDRGASGRPTLVLPDQQWRHRAAQTARSLPRRTGRKLRKMFA